jgi:hypothetical protein
MDPIGYLIAVGAVAATAALMLGPTARRVSSASDRRQDETPDADLWGSCSQCHLWFALDMAVDASWECPGCQRETSQIVNRRLQQLPAVAEASQEPPRIEEWPGSASW